MDFDPNGEVARAIREESPETELILTSAQEAHDLPMELRNEEGHIGREAAACIVNNEEI